MKKIITFFILIFCLSCEAKMDFIISSIEEKKPQERRVESVQKSKTQHEQLVSKLLLSAVDEINRGNLDEALKTLELCEDTIDSKTSSEAVEQYYKLKTTLYFVQKDYRSALSICKQAMKNIQSSGRDFFNFFCARLLYLAGEEKKSYELYLRLSRRDFHSFSKEDAVIFTRLLATFCEDFNFVKWSNFLIDRIGFNENVQNLLCDYLLSICSFEEALICRAETLFYLKQYQADDDLHIINKNDFPESLHKLEAFEPLLLWLQGDVAQNIYDEILSKLKQSDLRDYILIESNIKRKKIDESSLATLVKLQNRYKAFPAFHLLNAKAYSFVDSDDTNNLLNSLLDRSLCLSTNSLARNNVLDFMIEKNILTNENKKIILSSKEIEYLCYEIEKSGNPNLISPILNLAFSNINYFSALASEAVKKLSNVPYVSYYISNLLKNREEA